MNTLELEKQQEKQTKEDKNEMQTHGERCRRENVHQSAECGMYVVEYNITDSVAYTPRVVMRGNTDANT